jgi:predicted HTH transcriptional regulator
VGSVPWLFALAVLAFLASVWAVRWGARRFLRNFFALSNVRVPELKEALQEGESQRIEFKRGMSVDTPETRSSDTEVLKSVAAFANTNDGAIFIGVDDRGAIAGLKLDYKARDTFAQRIRNLIRNHIRPIPPVQVTFEELRGLLVAKIAVARGTESFYVMNGAVYVRDGSSDVLAQDGDYKRMLAET